MSGEPPKPDTNPPLPAGAEVVGEDLFMVPIGRDAEGYACFRMSSTSKLVPEAIFYRAAAGGFTMDRAQAVKG